MGREGEGMLKEPLHGGQLRSLTRKIIDEGEVEFSSHALAEMSKDGLSEMDIVSVLRAGTTEPGELERGTWRYRISTERICVVVAFRSEHWLVVVTAWRQGEQKR